MIEIKNLCKRFDSKTLFEDFNYTIEDGDFRSEEHTSELQSPR